jgi:sporulation protein YlmC with PRC-barrel domain
MLKTLAVSASVLAFASGSGLAESTLSTGQWLASDIYKAAVYDPSEHKVGNVRDLVIDSTGNVTAAIIGVSGGFLGANQKDVVIPFKELKVSSRDGKDWLVLNRTKDELMTAPAYNNTGSPSEYRGKGGDVR